MSTLLRRLEALEAVLDPMEPEREDEADYEVLAQRLEQMCARLKEREVLPEEERQKIATREQEERCRQCKLARESPTRRLVNIGCACELRPRLLAALERRANPPDIIAAMVTPAHGVMLVSDLEGPPSAPRPRSQSETVRENLALRAERDELKDYRDYDPAHIRWEPKAT